MTKREIIGWLVVILICAIVVWQMPATAQTVVPKTPPTELEVCQNNRAYIASEYEKLRVMNEQMAMRLLALSEEILTLKKPVIEPARDTTGCKRGRWRSGKHNNCGVW